MANEISFDLNLAIQHWRENLAQSPAFRSENLNELESHLRDSVAALQATGLSAEEAFSIANRRIGGDQELGTEFGKVNSRAVWLDRIFWILVGVQVWSAVSILSRTLAFMSLALGWKITNYDYQVNGLALPVAFYTLMQLAGMVVCLFFCWWLFTRKAQSVVSWLMPFLKRRMTLALGSILLCIASAIPLFLANLPMIIFQHNGYAMSRIIPPLSYAEVIFGVARLTGLALLTLLIARKRLRARIV
jgi:hypothetical protein